VPHRMEAGPLLGIAGALMLLVSLFLEWFDPGRSAWEVFEALDLALLAIALGSLLVAAGRLGAPVRVDPRALPLLGLAALTIVTVQLIQPPPAVRQADPELGGWLALAGSVLLAVAGLLTVARISVTVTLAGRELRHRVSAVDRRGAPAERDASPPPAEPSGTRPERTPHGGAAPLSAREGDDHASRNDDPPATDPDRTQPLATDDRPAPLHDTPGDAGPVR